jgi:hypothetical protein
LVPGSRGGVTGLMTEITLLGGERYCVDGGVKEVERLILDAARGSIMQFAWLIDTQTAEPLGVNPEYVMTLRPLRSTGQPTA